MDNAEEVMHSLEEFSKLKPKDIPRELDDYLGYVAKTGDPVFKWSIIKCLFREKLLNVITDFHESTLSIELPPCPNVDTFNYERMKANLLERLDSFHGAPFTVQRISELLTNPRKEYNRADKFMRAIEKNILVVSIREPGRYSEIDGDNQSEPSFNGIPEPNDSSIETSFTCNDLTDPDSSSQVYEVVNSDNHDTTYPVSLDANTSEAQVSAKSENIEDGSTSGTSSDDSQEENLIEISNIVEKSDSNSSDKESETVICSTVTSQPQEEEKLEDIDDDVPDETLVNSNLLPHNSENSSVEEISNKASSTEMENDTVIGSSSVDSIENSDSNEQTILDNSEADLHMVTVSEENNIEPVSEENLSNVESSNSEPEEQKEAVPAFSESVEIPNEDAAPLVFVDDRTVECDTSNPLVSESGCVDQENNENYIAENREDTTSEEEKNIIEDNEVVSSCQEILNENEHEETAIEDNTRETSVIHTTSEPEYTEPMEVEESQISVADQSSE